MKYILLLTALLLFSCDDSKDESGFISLEIEGCEYIYESSGYHFGITHKGNCKNPVHYKNIVTVYDTVTYKLIIDDGQSKTD